MDDGLVDRRALATVADGDPSALHHQGDVPECGEIVQGLAVRWLVSTLRVHTLPLVRS